MKQNNAKLHDKFKLAIMAFLLLAALFYYAWPTTTNVKADTTQYNVIADQQTAKIGDTIHISIQNAPSGFVAQIRVNASPKTISMSSNSFPIQVTTDNGFIDNSPNTITIITATDSSGNPLSLINNNIPLTINSSGSPTSTTPAPPTGVSVIDCNKEPTKCIYNPISTADNVTSLLVVFAKWFVGIMGIWAMLFIVIGGFKLMAGQGNEESTTAAKKTITWAIVGLLTSLLAFAIISIVTNLIGFKTS